MNYMKSMRIVYLALTLGIALFTLISVLLNRMLGPFMTASEAPADTYPYVIALGLLVFGTFLAYRVISPKKIESMAMLSSLESKLTEWRSLCIMRGALIEAPSFFAIVVFMLLGIHLLLLIPISGILLFWLIQPTRDKLVAEANLTPTEALEFDSKN